MKSTKCATTFSDFLKLCLKCIIIANVYCNIHKKYEYFMKYDTG